MFHVKHDLGHDPALEASDGFEYAPADAHNIGGPGPRSSPNRASILRPVAWCSRQPAVGGREEQSEPRDISDRSNDARSCPVASESVGAKRKRPHAGWSQEPVERGGAESASSLVLWGEAVVESEGGV